jgi:hypothetical protein
MRVSVGVFLVACGLAALVPLPGARSAPASTAEFPGRPSHFEGRPLRELSLGPTEKRFAIDFPGRIGRFTDGEREVVIRWVSSETRKLHPAVDCFRGVGYSVTPTPLSIDAAGSRWGTFVATRGDERLEVRERVYDASGHHWTDVSAWYWAAALGKSDGPWWAITVASTRN